MKKWFVLHDWTIYYASDGKKPPRYREAFFTHEGALKWIDKRQR